MPKFIKRNDKSHIGGMDTVQDFRSDTYPQTKCLLLRNLFPGDPPIPRNGCQDILVDGTALGYGNRHTIFKPPALVTKNQYGDIFVFVWNYYFRTFPVGPPYGAYSYQLECWDLDGEQRYITVSGYWFEEVYFGLLNIYGLIVALTDADMIGNEDGVTKGKRHKVVEWNNTTKLWVPRDLSISSYAQVGTPHDIQADSGLTAGLWVDYAATFVRRTDADAVNAYGVPKSTAVYSPGENEGYERLVDRETVNLESSTDTAYGDSTTKLTVEEKETGVYRYAWTGTGTEPSFGDLEENDWIKIVGENISLVNTGFRKVKEGFNDGSTAWVDVYSTSGEAQTEFALGSDGSIKKRYCMVILPYPGQTSVDDAILKGATHIRLYRTDHSENESVAQGLTHKYLKDWPLYGTEYTALAKTSATYGNATTELMINETTPGVFRYEWTGIGTKPLFGNLLANDWILVAGDNFNANIGYKKVKTSFHDATDAWVDIYSSTDGDMYPFVIGSSGSIRSIFGMLDVLSRNALDGEVNFLVMTNYTEAPLARFLCYNAARVFIGGGAKHGRWYYNEVPGGDGGTTLADLFPQKYLSMWKPTSYYIDCEPDDGQLDAGCAVLRDDTYFFKEKKVFVLHNGDITQRPDKVSNHLGCVFPNTIVVANMPNLGEFIFFVSAEGPCIITPGSSIRLLSDFSITELWPEGELLNKTNGELMTEWVREKVHAKIHQNTIFVVYGDSEDEDVQNVLTENKILGYNEQGERPFRGCMEINFNSFSIYYQARVRGYARAGTHVFTIT